MNTAMSLAFSNEMQKLAFSANKQSIVGDIINVMSKHMRAPVLIPTVAALSLGAGGILSASNKSVQSPHYAKASTFPITSEQV